ncbi:protein tiptop-like [Rhopalosiphum maidis]|uniref:protein tiptop-like n=1 Tax=Rhopalosiphum maidis TaxID=43146 RepID=UPI000EFDC103|nr:protein tiptop-like [Rhopalosiphum maidis]
MTRRKQHCPKRMKWEGGEGEEPPAGYQEDDGGCPEDDEDEEEEEEEGVSGGSSGSPPRSPIPSSTDVEQDVAVANERLPLRESNSPSKMSRGSPRSESSLPPYEVPLLATVSPGRSPPSLDVLDFSTKRPASPPASSQPAAMNLSNNNEDSPIDLTIRSKKIKLDPSPVSPSTDAYNRMSRPWAQYTTPVIRPISRGEMMTPPSDPVHMWNGKHGKLTYGSFPSAASDATKALEKMCELSKLQDEPRSVLAPSSGRHSAWQSHWLNKGADQTKDVLKCVWCKMSFPTLQAMSTHMAETKHGTAAAQSLQPPPPPPPPPVSTSSGHKNDLNMLIKETMPLPRKLVRGQDVWLGKGAEQTRQILKCMWCGQSFRSLQEMTTHMQQTQHYTNIISQEQIISWKSADENKSSSGGNNVSAASTSSPASSVNTSANHVSAVLTCKVCDQAFNSLKELSVHMVKNAHYKEHMMRSITEGSNRRRQTREKRKKSLPVRKLLELERAQHDVKNGDGGYPTSGGGFKAVNDTNHRLGRIICEKCGEKVDVASFMEHLRVCVTMTADQKNLLKTALMSQNSMSGATAEPGREKRPKKEQDRSQAAADLSMNKPTVAAATTGSSSPSVLNAIEKLIEKSFDSRLRYGTSATGASIGESILKRLGIDESVDATKPIMDVQAMSLLRSYQSLGRHERSGSESSSMSPELAAMRSDSTTPDRKYEPSEYQRMRSVTPKSTPERHSSPKSSSSSSGKGGHGGQEVSGGVEVKSEPSGGPDEGCVTGDFEVKKEYVDEDDAVVKSPAERRARSRESAEGSVADETNGSSRGPTPTNVKSPLSPAGSDKSMDNGKKTPVTSSSLGALSSMFESLTSAASSAGSGLSSSANGDGGGGKSGGGASSHPLAALQKLCDKTENHHHPHNHHHHHRPSSRSSSNASATNGGPAQSMSPPTSITGSTAPGAILAFSWACNDAVVTADSIMKCAFCDTPFISKGAYRHHLSKVHFVKEGITPEPIMLKPASSSSSSAAAAASGHQQSSSSSAAHSPSPSPSSSSQHKSSPNHNNNNSSSNNNNNNNNGSPSTSAGAGVKSPETKNGGGYDESPHSKFLKYTELAKQLSSKYV